MPAWLARVHTSVTSRVFPMPASPAISIIRAWPLCTDVAASTAAVSSLPRPISAELVTRLATR
jgi:hypothetical protein